MEEEIKMAIERLAERIRGDLSRATNGEDAVRYSQSILHLSHSLATLMDCMRV